MLPDRAIFDLARIVIRRGRRSLSTAIATISVIPCIAEKDAVAVRPTGLAILQKVANASSPARSLPVMVRTHDANNYLQYLGDHGTRVMALGGATEVSAVSRHFRCCIPHMTADHAGSTVGPSNSRRIVDAAQHELYPDTLR